MVRWLTRIALWVQGFWFVLYDILGSKVIPTSQNYLWGPFLQDVTRSFNEVVFNHAIGLPYNRHASEKLRNTAMKSRQSESFISSIDSLLFSLIPSLIDLYFGLRYLYTLTPLMVIVTMVVFPLYIYATVWVEAAVDPLKRNSHKVSKQVYPTSCLLDSFF